MTSRKGDPDLFNTPRDPNPYLKAPPPPPPPPPRPLSSSPRAPPSPRSLARATACQALARHSPRGPKTNFPQRWSGRGSGGLDGSSGLRWLDRV